MFKTILKTLGTWKFWKELVIMTVGMMVGAAAVYYFLVPSKLVIGSISGLSIVIAGIFENMGIAIKVSWVVVAINAILLILAWLLIGKEFGIKTVYTALILGPLMDLWEAILPYEKVIAEGATSVMGDPWFDLLCFVLMLSICQAILFNINASTGGLDILAKILNKYLHFDIGASVATINGEKITFLDTPGHEALSVPGSTVSRWTTSPPRSTVKNAFAWSQTTARRFAVSSSTILSAAAVSTI